MDTIIKEIDQWIDATIDDYKDQQQSCLTLPKDVHAFYEESFLQTAYFVETNTIPKPMFAKNIPGAADFLNMDVGGITYKNTYFVLPNIRLSTHVHELVHVAQWQMMGANAFIAHYISGIQRFGYRHSPLEEIAYAIQENFESKSSPYNVPKKVHEFLMKNNFLILD